MKPESIHNSNILLSPLNWGMGHVARCIPIIHQLIEQENRIIIACNKDQEQIFRAYFPDLIYVFHEGYPFSFKGKGNFERDIFLHFFKLKKRLKKEKKEVEKLVDTHSIDLVLADHRYGFISDKCTSIFITHQLNLPLPWYVRWVDRLHKKWMKAFHTIWVIDTHDSQFSGKLSQNKRKLNTIYIGPKSRFSLYPKMEKVIPFIVIISGPEPYAEQFFQEQYNIASSKTEKTIIITPKLYPHQPNEHIELVLSSDWKKTDEIVLQAQSIISRSGYSTIMDLKYLGINGRLVPTIGQREQEYLFLNHFDNYLYRETLKKL